MRWFKEILQKVLCVLTSHARYRRHRKEVTHISSNWQNNFELKGQRKKLKITGTEKGRAALTIFSAFL